MKKLSVWSSVVAVLALGSGCSSETTKDVEATRIETVKSSLARDLAPALADSERAAFVEGQADFALDLYHAVAALPENAGKGLFISPPSASIALGMAYAGAQGEVAAQMRSAMHLALPDERVHAGFDWLDLELARGDEASFRLDVANAMFARKGARFQTPFLDTLAVNYGAGINTVDFLHEPGQACDSINHWVDGKTEHRIPELLKKAQIQSDTNFVLVNAVYFKATWNSKFAETATGPMPFHMLDGTTSDAPMMRVMESFAYAKGDGYQAVSVPYAGGRQSMFVIVPDAGKFASVDAALTGRRVLDMLGATSQKLVALDYPKHHFDGSYSFKEPLEALGMKDFFGLGSLTGMMTDEAPGVDDVIQKTFLAVDENGTEAAAATAIISAGSSCCNEPPKPDVTLTIDRPFIEAIVDNETKTLVFVGRIVDPK